MSKSQAQSILQSHGYTNIIQMNTCIRLEASKRSWASISKTSNGQEWVVVIHPDGHIDQVQLDTNGRPLYEKIKSMFIKPGLPSEAVVSIGLSPSGKLYWESRGIYYDLYGVRLKDLPTP